MMYIKQINITIDIYAVIVQTGNNDRSIEKDISSSTSATVYLGAKIGFVF